MKSQSELNWVFILIIGAIILAFFTAFAFKYKSLQDEKTSIEILNTMDNSLTSLKTSPYATFDSINLPLDVQVTCNNLIINEKTYATKNLLFSQKKLSKKMSDLRQAQNEESGKKILQEINELNKKKEDIKNNRLKR